MCSGYCSRAVAFIKALEVHLRTLFRGLITSLGKDMKIHMCGALVNDGERCVPRGPRSRCELWQLQACLQSRDSAHAALMASALGVRGPHLGNFSSGKPRTASSSRMPKTQLECWNYWGASERVDLFTAVVTAIKASSGAQLLPGWSGLL